MTSEASKKIIQGLCSDVSNDIIQDFFARMDDDYFTTFAPEEIAKHIGMSSSLDSTHRLQVHVRSRQTRDPRAGTFDIVIVGFDYLSEFSVFCGLLSAFGLDIRAGNIYSFAKRGFQGSPRKFVDVFSVSIKEGEIFDEVEQRSFQHELQTLAGWLAAGSVVEARERLNRFLTERIEKMDAPLAGLLYPLEVQFDNQSSSDWTLMEVRSKDTFAFLYAISNALAMNGVDIHKVKIRNAGSEARDQFFVADRWGRKIEDTTEQERLRTAVGMMKQFTRFLPDAPDPGKAMRHFDQFLDKMSAERLPQHIISFLAAEEGMTRLARVLGSSDYLWDDFLSRHFRDFLPLLQDFAAPGKKPVRSRLRSQMSAASSFEEKKRVLNEFKDSELFRIDVHHLLDENITLIDFSHSLTELAEAVVDEAARICQEYLGGARGLFTICGLGKFGGGEMGYASDLEMIFIHEQSGNTPYFEALARQTIDFIESRPGGIFHIDLRLRPYGDAGAWSLPFDEFKRYYSPQGQAAPFERQALIKLRWVAGDEGLGRRVEEHRDAFTYSGAPWDSENALHLRRRQIRELVRPGQTNVKYSAGGIVDIEYAAQYQQLLHGKDHPGLRLTNTLEALTQLRRLRFVEESEYVLLRSAYLFLRKLIDALRIVRGDASDLTLPAETSDEFKSLARRLGYRQRDRARSASALAGDILEWMTKVHGYFVRQVEEK